MQVWFGKFNFASILYNLKKECHNSVFTYVPLYPSINATGEASSELQKKKLQFVYLRKFITWRYVFKTWILFCFVLFRH